MQKFENQIVGSQYVLLLLDFSLFLIPRNVLQSINVVPLWKNAVMSFTLRRGLKPDVLVMDVSVNQYLMLFIH